MEQSRKLKADLDAKQKGAEVLISEANDRLQKAMTTKNMSEVMAAQALLQQGTKIQAYDRHKRENIEKQSVGKKRAL